MNDDSKVHFASLKESLKEAWGFLWGNTDLLIFVLLEIPILTQVIFYIFNGKGNWLTFYLWIAFVYTIYTFCNAVLLACIYERISGRAASLGDSIAKINTYLWKLLLWCLYMVTVGFFWKTLNYILWLTTKIHFDSSYFFRPVFSQIVAFQKWPWEAIKFSAVEVIMNKKTFFRLEACFSIFSMFLGLLVIGFFILFLPEKGSSSMSRISFQTLLEYQLQVIDYVAAGLVLFFYLLDNLFRLYFSAVFLRACERRSQSSELTGPSIQ